MAIPIEPYKAETIASLALAIDPSIVGIVIMTEKGFDVRTGLPDSLVITMLEAVVDSFRRRN